LLLKKSLTKELKIGEAGELARMERGQGIVGQPEAEQLAAVGPNGGREAGDQIVGEVQIL
jgi:hypothetical protein